MTDSIHDGLIALAERCREDLLEVAIILYSTVGAINGDSLRTLASVVADFTKNDLRRIQARYN